MIYEVCSCVEYPSKYALVICWCSTFEKAQQERVLLEKCYQDQHRIFFIREKEDLTNNK